MNGKKGQEAAFGMPEIKSLLIALAVLLVLLLLILLFAKRGEMLLGQNATRLLLRRGLA